MDFLVLVIKISKKRVGILLLILYSNNAFAHVSFLAISVVGLPIVAFVLAVILGLYKLGFLEFLRFSLVLFFAGSLQYFVNQYIPFYENKVLVILITICNWILVYWLLFLQISKTKK